MMTLNPPLRPLRVASITLCLAVAAVGTGCGTKKERRANVTRPALPVVVATLVTKDEIRLSPAEFGAGAVEVLVSNRSGKPRRITVKGNGAAALATTPISDGETSKAQAILEPGVYTVDAGTGVTPAKLVVGPQRPSSQNELITP